MNPADITLGLAVLAGLASFLSPCVLALVPAYVGYLGGRAVTSTNVEQHNRWQTFSHGLAFVLGFSIIFVLLGVAASALGTLLYDIRTWISRIGGLVVIIFGLHTLGVLNIPFLDYDTRRQYSPGGQDYGSSMLMGVFFSAGWAPCVGPVLGAVLTLALNGGSIQQGAMLLAAYALGLAIPFLFAALGVGWVTNLLRKHQRFIRVFSMVTGIILVVVGVMLFTGTLEALARFGFFVDFGL